MSEPSSSLASGSLTTGQFAFTPLPSSVSCTAGGSATQPFLLPAGYAQTIVSSEPNGGTADLWDMNTQNETGPEAGSFMYQSHEVVGNGQVSEVDLETGATRVLAQRADWERLDGIVWTPWGSLLTAEEATNAVFKDPAVPQALNGLVYEIDPASGSNVARPAIGSKSHEGMRFDPSGNLYSISETNPGYIYRFVPDNRGDLSSGQLYVLKIVTSTGDRTGEAEWIALDRPAVQVDAVAAAAAVGATGYNRPEDVEIATSTGNDRGGSNTLYVAVTGAAAPADERVLAIDLREPAGGGEHATAFVYDYVRKGLNAPADFQMPDNLALDKNGNLYIAEDPAAAPTTGRGDDIWAAPAPKAGLHQPAEPIQRFASLTDCLAEPTGIYFDLRSWALYVHAQHRGGDGRDELVKIVRAE
jgi:secreted PhoX family phosphatase